MGSPAGAELPAGGGAGEVILTLQCGQGAVVGGRSNGIWISPRQESQ
jgi:hypothetical protein